MPWREDMVLNHRIAVGHPPARNDAQYGESVRATFLATSGGHPRAIASETDCVAMVETMA